MDALELNGIKYVKASSIARELGYTADYVGQLCRAGKVEAQLVGRSWFVNEDSILDHKKSRYRSNTSKTVSEFKNEIQKRKDESIERETQKAAQQPNRNFYSYSMATTALYEEDVSELIPTLKRRSSTNNSSEVEVRHADAKSVPVTKGKESYNLEASERPEIRFTGPVSIVDPEEGDEQEQEQTPPEKEHSKVPTKPLEGEKVKLRNAEKGSKEPKSFFDRVHKKGVALSIQHDQPAKASEHQEGVQIKRGGVVEMTRLNLVTEDEPSGVSISSTTTTVQKSRPFTFVYITASLLIALVISVGFVFLEASVVSTNESTDTSYSFNLSSAYESIKALK